MPFGEHIPLPAAGSFVLHFGEHAYFSAEKLLRTTKSTSENIFAPLIVFLVARLAARCEAPEKEDCGIFNPNANIRRALYFKPPGSLFPHAPQARSWDPSRYLYLTGSRRGLRSAPQESGPLSGKGDARKPSWNEKL